MEGGGGSGRRRSEVPSPCTFLVPDALTGPDPAWVPARLGPCLDVIVYILVALLPWSPTHPYVPDVRLSLPELICSPVAVIIPFNLAAVQRTTCAVQRTTNGCELHPSGDVP